MAKTCYFFGAARSDGDATMKPLLGGKGANLAEMAKLGIPVPPGFTLTTEVCNAFLAHGGALPDDVRAEVLSSLAEVETTTGRRFGDVDKPLLVSVRSGARASMPGMMDTILNLGLNDAIAEGLAKATKNPRFAFDAYRRFIAMYANVVLEIERSHFEDLLDVPRRAVATKLGLRVDTMNGEELRQKVPDALLDDVALRDLVERSKAIVLAKTGKPFPTDPKEQLWGAIAAVFKSWWNDRAKTYRGMNHIPESWGTACTVQAMVFGNLGDTSATGVAFTRDPRSGERRFFGEWLPNAQGEDVVAGTRTPLSVTRHAGGDESLEAKSPVVYAELVKIYETLEKHYRDMLDIEFTIQDGVLYMLQCRVGGRSGRAEVRTAVEMVREGLITKEEALLRVSPHKLDELLHPTLDPDAPKTLLAKGLPAGPGAATGHVVFSADEAERRAAQGKNVILVRRETSPEDIHGMKAAVGILTARGGMTSHAAVVARVIGKCCVAGCSPASVDYQTQTMTITLYGSDGHATGTAVVKAGDVITLWVDDKAGHVFKGEVPMIPASTTPEYEELMRWSDEFRTMKIRANADKDVEARSARAFGAEGIGLCRTEHMFFDPERIAIMRQMIVAETVKERDVALDKLLPFQRGDFAALFREMRGLPVTIRLLDPPLHEFLPTDEDQFQHLAMLTGVSSDVLKRRTAERHEVNPMLGHRGVRLAITYPEIYAMQVRAILEAACDVAAEGIEVFPEIMIPLAMTKAELTHSRAITDRVAKLVFAQRGREVKFAFGTMIELPRAAIVAGSLAEEAEFFSFGTNDLTQTTLGLSRDDAGKFMGAYQEAGIFARDPFQTLDEEGVGFLVRMACESGKKARPGIKLGICGEHGGDPASIAFCQAVGLSYVSCAPFRVPIARLAAAQAALRAKGNTSSSSAVLGAWCFSPARALFRRSAHCEALVCLSFACLGIGPLSAKTTQAPRCGSGLSVRRETLSPLVLRLRELAESDRRAVLDDRGETTHRALARRAAGVAHVLLDGAPTLDGARVAILARPGGEWVASFFGVVLAGGVAVPLSPLHPEPEIRWFCADSGLAHALVDREHAPRIGWLGDVRVLDADAIAEADAIANASRADDVALLLYTSGTTGKPKGARITHANVFVQASLLHDAWRVTEHDRLLHALPLHHLHGLGISLMTTLLAGASAKMLPRFEPARFWDELASVTTMMAVPTMYHRLFVAFDAADEATRARWSSSARALRLATSGSAALPVSLAERWRALTGHIPVERFGMTEIGVGASNPLEGARKPGSVGLPLATVELRIVDEHGRDAPPGEPGEIRVRGPSVFAGYHERPDATRASFDEGGYFLTGDTALRDAEGYVKILGRTSVDILKSGGFKLSALEIEEAIRLHPDVVDVAVVGVPDEAWGDRVVAVLVARRPDAALTTDDVRAFLRDHLAPYKIPREAVVVAELPRNAIGKVQKPEVVRRLLVTLLHSASPMAKLDPKQLLRAGARYLREHPGVLGKVVFNAAALKVTVPLDVLRFFAGKLGEGKKSAPKDVLVEARSPALHVGASVSAMGTPIRFAASIKIEEARIGEHELRFDIRLSEVSLKLEGESDSPIGALIKSGALDLSKPGNLAKFMPNRPPALVEAEGDRIVLDLMKDAKIAGNPKVRRVLDLLSPVLQLKGIATEGDNLVIAFRAKPSGVSEVVSRMRRGLGGCGL